MEKPIDKKTLEELLTLLVERGEAEYNNELLQIRENRNCSRINEEKFNRLVCEIGQKDIYGREFYEWLKKQGFIFWYGESRHPQYGGANYLLGKIQQNGKGETPAGGGYKWFIVETETSDFHGLETIENYDYYQSLVHTPWVPKWGEVIGNKTITKRSFGEYLWLFNKEIKNDDEERLKLFPSMYAEYKFLYPHLQRAMKALQTPSSSCFMDEAKAKDFFTSLCAQEALELLLFYEFPTILDEGKSPQPRKRTYLTQLSKRPSFFTLSNLMNMSHPDLKKEADEILEMFKEKGYSKERLAEANLREIQKVAKELLVKV